MPLSMDQEAYEYIISPQRPLTKFSHSLGY